MTENQHVVITHEPQGILVIRINRLETKNALTMAMYARMTEALKAADADADVRVAAIYGDPSCFTSGNDLKDFMEHPPQGPQSPVFRFLEAITTFGKPIVAGVGGAAVGIGTTLLLHCDLVYATPATRFQLPFVPLGLCPEAASSYLLPLMAGYQRAAELLLLGAPFSADQAQAMGLVNAQIVDEQLVAHVMAQAARIAALPPAAVRITRQLMKQGAAAAIQQTMLREGELFVERLRSPEAREAFSAFFEKRKPDFSKFV
ncbi:MAG: enoyl-CoA hydratase [Desulfobacterales bacterium]|jgi:enoyl-CoA hydratase/carnithine racemase